MSEEISRGEGANVLYLLFLGAREPKYFPHENRR